VLCERGHAGRIVLSHDAMCHCDWFPPALAGSWKEWRWTHIPDDVLPAMQAAGISDEDIRTMMVDNPRLILEGCAPY
jgi:phosphotriesterase-related protein